MSTMSAQTKMVVRQYVRGVYATQKHRIAMGNQVVACWRAREGLEPSVPNDKADAETKKVLDKLRLDYKLIAEGVAKLSKKSFKGTELISTWAELVMVQGYLEMLDAERAQFARLDGILKDHPIYPWLNSVQGVGPAMAGVIISEIDIEKAEYPSSLWKYAGLDVAPDGRGRSRRKEHLVPKEYKDSDGNVVKTCGITYNKNLKTKLVGVLGTVFVKQKAEKCPYRKIYDDYKHRLETSPRELEREARRAEEAKAKGHRYMPKGHRHNKAIRYAVKRFLVDLHVEWRKVEGLPVSEEYSVAKLGLIHRKAG